MGQYTSYYLYEKYERRCSGNSDGDCSDWIPSYPNVFSKDGDGSMPLVVRIDSDVDCGWHCIPEYQWVDVPIEDDYICDECELDIEFRWVNTSAYTYFGDYKYEVQQEQFRKDGGEWQDTQNTRYHNTGIKVGKKIKITMDNGDVFSQSCGTDDGVWHSYNNGDYKVYSDKLFQHTTNLITSDGMAVLSGDLSKVPIATVTWGYDFGYVNKVEFGECVKELGWRYRNTPYKEPCTDPKCIDTGGGGGCGPSYWDNDVSTSGERMRNTNVSSFCGIGLREISFPEGLRWIGGGSIFANNRLTSITFPSSVETIGYVRTFDSCMDHGSCMDHTDSNAFAGNYYLKEIHFNDGLKSIGDGDFAGCISLTRVDIPSSVERMGSRVFSGCSNLKQIVFHSETPPTSICTDDHWYYTDQCRGEEPNLYVNDDVFVYIPCGSLSAYTNYLSDVPSDRIVEYSGACGNIPPINSMYNVLYTYKVGSATTTIYRGLYDTGSTNYIRTDEEFYVIDEYADEITIPPNTEVLGVVHTTDCGKLTLYGKLVGSTSVPTNLYSNAGEFVISSSDVEATIYGGNLTTGVTISSGYSPVIWGSFADLPNLEEVNIDGNPTLRGNSFANCPSLSDINITYTGSVINVLSAQSSSVLSGSNPVIHVPCELYEVYTEHPFWKKFTIVRDTDQCQQTSYLRITSNTFREVTNSEYYQYSGGTDEMTIACKGIEKITFKHRVCGNGGMGTYLTFYLDSGSGYSYQCSVSTQSVDTYEMEIPDDGEEHIVRIVGIKNTSFYIDNYFGFNYY